MSYKLSISILLAFIIVQISSEAQEQAGLSADPRAGVYAIFSNPAYSAFYPHKWHANIFSAHAFIQTDIGYVQKSSLLDLIGNTGNLDVISNPSEINESSTTRQVVFDRDGGRKSGSFAASILWPAAIWEKSSTEMIGVYLETNIVGSTFRLPEQVGYYEASGVINNPTEIGIFEMSYMNWTDLGVHYSKMIEQNDYESTAIGINAKLILPHEAGRFRSKNEIVYNRIGDIYTATGLETSSQYTFFNTGYSPRFNGIGLGADLGYVYASDDYSFGVSLLDLGFALYSGNSETYDIISDTTVIFDGSVIVDPEDIGEILLEIDRQLEPQISRLVDNGASFLLGLPTAISLQYHRKFNQNWSLNTQLVQRVPFFSKSVRRPSSISVVPRYKKGLLELAIPLSLYEYKDVRVGAIFKYMYFFFGSDDLLSLAGRQKFNGTDLYFGIQVYPFSNEREKKGVHCFKF